MRGFFILGLVWATLGSAVAQQKAVVLGKVSGGERDSIMIAVQANSLDPKENQFKVPVNKKGEFRFDIALSGSTMAELVYEGEDAGLYLAAGEPLQVSFKAGKMLASLTFKGNKAVENTFLARFDKKFVENEGYQVLPDIIFYREKEFTQFLDERKEAQLDFYNKYTDKGSFSEEFKAFALAQIEYGWANDKLTYVDLRERIVHAEPRLKVSEGYYDFLQKVELNNPAALGCLNYTTFLKNYFQFQAALALRRKTDPDYYKYSFEAAKQVLQGEVRSHLLGQILYESFRFGHIRYSDEMYAEYKQLNNKQAYLTFLDAVYAANKRFALGAPAPDLEVTTAAGETVHLSDFKGKVVYLSFWTTNCGLCLMDMSYSQNLTDKLDGQNIVFVTIGLDEDAKAWRTMVTKKKLSGVHGYAKGMKSEVAQSYALGDLPAYFLIDDDGTFMNVKPKRPSSHEAARELLQVFEVKSGANSPRSAK